MKKKILNRALRIAVCLLNEREVCPPEGTTERCDVCEDDAVCKRCIENWLIIKAQKELKKEGKL